MKQKSRVERRRKKAKVGLQILHEQLGDILNSVALHAQKIVNRRSRIVGVWYRTANICVLKQYTRWSWGLQCEGAQTVDHDNVG